MKVKIMTHDNKEAGSIDLPPQFAEEVRTDLISRSVLSIQAANRQPYGGYGNAGQRHSSKVSRRRRDYRGAYGMGVSRVPRKIVSRRGRRMNWIGATSPGTVGGRRAHPPKPYSDWEQKVNTTENRKAIRSALAATMHKDIVTTRGHLVPPSFPFIIDSSFENLVKAKDLEAALLALGFEKELARAGKTGIRAGKGKMRGRKHKSPTSILFVVSKDASKLVKAASNLPGMDVISVHRVNAELLAPGAHPGRLTLYTKAAVERLASEGLFTKAHKGEKAVKAAKPKKEAAETEAAPKKAAAAKKAPAKKAKTE